MIRPATSRYFLPSVILAACLLTLETQGWTPSLYGNNRSIRRQQQARALTLLAASTVQPPDKPQPSAKAVELKKSLLVRIQTLRDLQERDGDISIDFGVKGGELNKTSRAPQTVDYYSISPDVGTAADSIMDTCEELSRVSPIAHPTAYLGDKNMDPSLAPLNGAWKLLFSTAADASFSKNSTRGAAQAQNVVDPAAGRITNVIDFAVRDDGTEPALKQLQVVIKAVAASKTRVNLYFRYARLVLTKFFFFPLFGRKLVLYIPVPATLITRLIVFFGRIFRRKGVTKVPVPFFEILYLDSELRVQRTGESNLFVQAKESWEAAQPLLL